MSRLVRSAILFSLIGWILSAYCLVHTTALSMFLFFALGLPAFGLGLLLYLLAIWRDLRRHDVI